MPKPRKPVRSGEQAKQHGAVASAKKSLSQASASASVSPKSHTDDTMIEPGKVTSVKRSLESALAESSKQGSRLTSSSKGRVHNFHSSSSSSSVSSPGPASSDETVPFRKPPKRHTAKLKGTTDTNPMQGTSTSKYQAIAEVLHCKGVVYARMTYTTLCSLIHLRSVHSHVSDWVSAAAILEALKSNNGVIQEHGKEDKHLLQVPEMSRMYAQTFLTKLVINHLNDTESLHPPMVLMRRLTKSSLMLLGREPDVWCYPSELLSMGENMTDDSATPREIVKLADAITAQTGYQISRSNWEYQEETDDTAQNLGILSLEPEGLVHEIVYSKEVEATSLVNPSDQSTPPSPTPSITPTPSQGSAVSEAHNDDSPELLSENAEDAKSEGSVSSPDGPNESKVAHRYVTCFVHSTLDHRMLKNYFSAICDNSETKVKWVTAKQFLQAIREQGIVCPGSHTQAAVELQDWEPNCDAWFARSELRCLNLKKHSYTECTSTCLTSPCMSIWFTQSRLKL